MGVESIEMTRFSPSAVSIENTSVRGRSLINHMTKSEWNLHPVPPRFSTTAKKAGDLIITGHFIEVACFYIFIHYSPIRCSIQTLGSI